MWRTLVSVCARKFCRESPPVPSGGFAVDGGSCSSADGVCDMFPNNLFLVDHTTPYSVIPASCSNLYARAPGLGTPRYQAREQVTYCRDVAI